MVRQPDLACPELRALVERDPLAAAKHVELCQACIGSAAAEVVVFQAEPARPRPEPAALTHP